GVEPAVVPVSAQTNGGAEPEPPAPLEEASQERSLRLAVKTPAPATLVRAEATTFTDSDLTTAEKVIALAPGSCRWPLGAPGDPDFCFCNRSTITPPYCPQHHAAAYITRSPSHPNGGSRPQLVDLI